MNEKQERFVGFGGQQCSHGDILVAANATNNLEEKYALAAMVINGFREDIKWACAPEHIKRTPVSGEVFDPVTLEVPSEYSQYIDEAVSQGTISTTDFTANLLLQEQSLNSIRVGEFNRPTPRIVINTYGFFKPAPLQSAENYIRAEKEHPIPSGYQRVADSTFLFTRLEKLPDNKATSISFNKSCSSNGRDGHKGGSYSNFSDGGGDCIRGSICVTTRDGRSSCGEATYSRGGGGDYSFKSW